MSSKYWQGCGWLFCHISDCLHVWMLSSATLTVWIQSLPCYWNVSEKTGVKKQLEGQIEPRSFKHKPWHRANNTQLNKEHVSVEVRMTSVVWCYSGFMFCKFWRDGFSHIKRTTQSHTHTHTFGFVWAARKSENCFTLERDRYKIMWQ